MLHRVTNMVDLFESRQEIQGVHQTYSHSESTTKTQSDAVKVPFSYLAQP